MFSVERVSDFLCHSNDGNVWISFDAKDQRKLYSDLRSLMPLNLMDGYVEEDMKKKKPKDKTIEVMLKWMIEKSPDGDLEKLLDGAEFICRRGLLTRMALGHYLKNKGKGDWTAIAERRNGVIYLEERMPELSKEKETEDFILQGSYMHTRFGESLIVPSDADENKRPSDIRSAFVADIRNANNNKTRILYSGEVDAVDEKGKHVELKTQYLRSLGGFWFLKEKSAKWWLQSKFVGVDYLLVGIKDDNGAVNEVMKVEIDSLKNSQWNGRDFFNELHNTLRYIYKNLPEGEVVKIKCTNGRLQCNPVSDTILSNEFIRHFQI